jgi:protein-S-isoprenylcysteine O-methyltransferase Ste14
MYRLLLTMATDIRLVIFLIATAFLAFVSRGSLKNPRSHGFYRFFAWEAIVALILVNIPVWFADPLSEVQIVSWIVLALSLVLLGPGVHQLLARGRPTAHRKDDTLMAFEKTSALVTSGLYRYIRHPLYGSLLFLAWGAFLKDITWYSTCLVVLSTIWLVATAKADERECIEFFGPSYNEYMGRTKMFIPWIW